MNSLKEAYSLGKSLALIKFAEDIKLPRIDDGATLAALLEASLESKRQGSGFSEVIESTERGGGSSWGDKMELETPKNTGINV